MEKPGGDSSRNLGPFETDSPHPEQSLFFQYANTNKLGITLDIEHPEGQKIFIRLLKKADVVIETFPAGYLEAISLGFDKLKEVNPRMILVSVTGFGQEGPRRRYKACDLVAAAFGGQMSVSGLPSKPLQPFGEQSYCTASLFGAIAILLALRNRKKTGRGEHIDLSLQESVVATLEHVMVRYFSEGVIPQREGSLHWNRSFCISPCKDGDILMTPFWKWETLVEWLEGEGMAEDLPDEKYLAEEYRRRHIAHIQDVLQKWTKTHTVQELTELAQTMRFPWAPIDSPGKVLENPHLRARDFFGRMQTRLGRTLLCPRGPFKGFAGDLRKGAPRIGEDNDQVYQALLGLSASEMARLAEQKAI